MRFKSHTFEGHQAAWLVIFLQQRLASRIWLWKMPVEADARGEQRRMGGESTRETPDGLPEAQVAWSSYKFISQ